MLRSSACTRTGRGAILGVANGTTSPPTRCGRSRRGRRVSRRAPAPSGRAVVVERCRRRCRCARACPQDRAVLTRLEARLRNGSSPARSRMRGRVVDAGRRPRRARARRSSDRASRDVTVLWFIQRVSTWVGGQEPGESDAMPARGQCAPDRRRDGTFLLQRPGAG
jgi:hypothetical protein